MLIHPETDATSRFGGYKHQSIKELDGGCLLATAGPTSRRNSAWLDRGIFLWQKRLGPGSVDRSGFECDPGTIRNLNPINVWDDRRFIPSAVTSKLLTTGNAVQQSRMRQDSYHASRP